MLILWTIANGDLFVGKHFLFVEAAPVVTTVFEGFVAFDCQVHFVEVDENVALNLEYCVTEDFHGLFHFTICELVKKALKTFYNIVI